MKRIAIGLTLLGVVGIGLYSCESREAFTTTSETQFAGVPVVVIEEALNTLTLETVSIPETASFHLEHVSKTHLPLFGDIEMVTEHGDYIANGRIHAGFPENAIHLTTVSSALVEVTIDAPRITATEHMEEALDVGGVWKQDHFQFEAEQKAVALLRDTACKADILGRANRNAQSAIERIVHGVSPRTTVIVHLTKPASC